MGRFLDIVDKFIKDRPSALNTVAPEISNPACVPDIDIALRSVEETRHLRDEWADACLALAESQDWESIEFKQAHRVSPGEYGWRLFCARANLTRLRDQTYPALLKQLNLDKPH